MLQQAFGTGPSIGSAEAEADCLTVTCFPDSGGCCLFGSAFGFLGSLCLIHKNVCLPHFLVLWGGEYVNIVEITNRVCRFVGGLFFSIDSILVANL